MKLHHQEITIKVLVPEGYYISDVVTEQLVVPRIAECHDVDCDIINDMMTSRITLKLDKDHAPRS